MCVLLCALGSISKFISSTFHFSEWNSDKLFMTNERMYQTVVIWNVQTVVQSPSILLASFSLYPIQFYKKKVLMDCFCQNKTEIPKFVKGWDKNIITDEPQYLLNFILGRKWYLQWARFFSIKVISSLIPVTHKGYTQEPHFLKSKINHSWAPVSSVKSSQLFWILGELFLNFYTTFQRDR